MLKLDYHMHTHFSFDGHDSIDDMAAAALRLGLDEIALTDHIDFYDMDKTEQSPTDYKKYMSELYAAREKYAGRLNIVFGAEIGVNSYSNGTVKRLIKEHSFDFVIASCHDIRGADFSFPESYIGKSKLQSYREYFENMYQCASNIEDYCVLGHMDYISRYGPYPDKNADADEYMDIIDKVLKTVIEKGKGIEVNTSGFSYGMNNPHPSNKIIKRYKELGGEILTVGSDAHSAGRVAQSFDKALDIIKSAGFTAVCRFRNREPEFVKIC